MNPARCILLYRHFFGTGHGAAAIAEEKPQQPAQRQSLAAFMMGGG